MGVISLKRLGIDYYEVRYRLQIAKRGGEVKFAQVILRVSTVDNEILILEQNNS